jgi:UDP-glucose 6-dehydrogenase
MAADPRIGDTHLDPVHQSHPDKEPGRGAGGDCFIKDFAAIREQFVGVLDDPAGRAVWEAMEKKNIDLLCRTNKDIDLLKEVYGNSVCDGS